MILVTSNKAKRLLLVSYIGRVIPDELVRNREDLITLLAELQPDCRVLVNLSQMEEMDRDCATEIGRVMELFDQAEKSKIVRVIPHADQDIGFNIMTAFHYKDPSKIVTFTTMNEACEHLGL